MVITSFDNAKIQLAAKLLDKKFRKSEGKYLIEGERLVRDAILHGAKVESVFVRQSDADKYAFNDAIVVADKVFGKLTDTISPQGVIAVVCKEAERASTPVGNCLVLDGLQDPGNVGTLLRSAVACGFSDVFAVNSVDLYSPKVLRSAMSAHFCVELHESQSIEDVLQTLSATRQVFACDMGGENVFDVDFANPCAVVVGNEGNGISDYTKSHAKIVALPMRGELESLNAAIAGSVVMYQIFSKSIK